MDRLPWEVTPEFTEDRLRLVAATFDRVRHEAVDAQEPDKGDGNWGLGCRAYERTCYALSKQSTESANKRWFAVEAEKLECTLRIGGVPIKFYRGESQDPKPRALRGGAKLALRNAASGQADMFEAFGEKRDESEWFWLLAVETHGDGTVARVVVFQATEDGRGRNYWPIPLHESIPSVADVTPIAREGVELPRPKVSAKAPAQEAPASADSASDGSSK